MRLFTSCLFFMGTITWAYGQYTLTGLKGMINVPEASVLEDGHFLLGMHTNAAAYKLITYNDRPSGGEYISMASIGFLDRLNITFTLSRIFGDPKQSVGNLSSIGDRSMQLTYLAMKERKYLPSVVLNLTDPLFSTNQYLAGNHIVATKTVWSEGIHSVKTTLGYGIPYLLIFQGQEHRQLKRKESDFLTGFFGGLRYIYQPWHLNASVEYDGRVVNSGVGVVLWNHLSLQGYLEGCKYPGIGFNFTGAIH